MAEAVIDNIEQDEAVALFGSRDENLRLLRDTLGLKVIARNKTVSLQGTDEQVGQGIKVLDRMRAHYRTQKAVSAEDVRTFLTVAMNPGVPEKPLSREISGPVRKLRAKTDGQSKYVEAIRQNDLVFCLGPAGTGKTYLAVAAALESMMTRQIKRLVLVRPAVEAGEKLGFLPGDMEAKVHPYLRPLLDALQEMVDSHQIKNYFENDVIEIAPLAFMRGRTLNDSFIILDEGQNATIPQMKMFLTRMGMGSKIVVTGDVTQVDLPGGVANGLDDAVRRLGSLARVAVVRMEKSDIVRHPLVQAIVEAYETPVAAKAPPAGETRIGT